MFEDNNINASLELPYKLFEINSNKTYFCIQLQDIYEEINKYISTNFKIIIKNRDYINIKNVIETYIDISIYDLYNFYKEIKNIDRNFKNSKKATLKSYTNNKIIEIILLDNTDLKININIKINSEIEININTITKYSDIYDYIRNFSKFFREIEELEKNYNFL